MSNLIYVGELLVEIEDDVFEWLVHKAFANEADAIKWENEDPKYRVISPVDLE